MNVREIKGLKLLLVAGSILAGLLLCEVLARFTYSASDFMPAQPATDPVLGHRLRPFEAGHDARGLRNENAAGDFPVVCLGDSQMYGDGIPRKYTIPQQLSRIINKRVYNMGLGGYGPVHYYHLLKEAQELHPQKIIVGFYMGNDILDAYYMAARHDRWKWLMPEPGAEDRLDSIAPCSIPYTTPDINIEDVYSVSDIITLQLKTSDSIVWKVHSFLRLHSALYSLQYAGLVKPLIQRLFEQKKHIQRPGAFACRQVDTIFIPGINMKNFDLKDQKVRQGILITRRIIELMARDYPRDQLLFFFIPTKEAVYFQYLKNAQVALPPEFICSVHYENAVTALLTRAIKTAGLQVVDVFPALEKAALQGNLVYHFSSDVHLNVEGARIVASCLAKALEKDGKVAKRE